MNNVTDLSPNFEIATDNQPIEILATTQIKAVIKQHQVFVKMILIEFLNLPPTVIPETI